MTEPNYAKLSSMHFYGWKKGLKTGMYYLRTRAAVDAIKFTVDQQGLAAKNKQDAKGPTPPPKPPADEGCLSCGA